MTRELDHIHRNLPIPVLGEVSHTRNQSAQSQKYVLCQCDLAPVNKSVDGVELACISTRHYHREYRIRFSSGGPCSKRGAKAGQSAPYPGRGSGLRAERLGGSTPSPQMATTRFISKSISVATPGGGSSGVQQSCPSGSGPRRREGLDNHPSARCLNL